MIFAICCNGSIDLFNTVFKKNAREFVNKAWKGFYPVHIVSLFHNYQLLGELTKIGICADEKTGYYSIDWTPLMLAAGNNNQEYGEYKLGETERRDATVQLLLRNGANIDSFTDDGSTPLLIACKNGYNSTVQLLLDNKAKIELCQRKNNSPLHIACENGHNSIVQLLLSKGADIDLRNKDGISPLYIACQNGHDSTVQLLLDKGAVINLREKEEASPLYISRKSGYDSIVQLLLEKLSQT